MKLVLPLETFSRSDLSSGRQNKRGSLHHKHALLLKYCMLGMSMMQRLVRHTPCASCNQPQYFWNLVTLTEGHHHICGLDANMWQAGPGSHRRTSR